MHHVSDTDELAIADLDALADARQYWTATLDACGTGIREADYERDSE